MVPKLRRWIISDTHWGHTALQKHARRPADVDSRIIKACQRLILPTDLVLHLGDVSFNFFDLKALMADLPGKWVLVRGNHDTKSVSWYMDHGFVFACDALTMSGCYFTHKPSPILPEGCQYNVHGHLHNRFAADHRKFPHCRLFALEHSNYQPMLLEKFLKKGCPGGEVLQEEVVGLSHLPDLDWMKLPVHKMKFPKPHAAWCVYKNLVGGKCNCGVDPDARREETNVILA